MCTWLLRPDVFTWIMIVIGDDMACECLCVCERCVCYMLQSGAQDAVEAGFQLG